MEGDGEGVVAIVQGLRDAGLAVTLMGRRHVSGRSKINGALGQLTHTKSSVETSTKGLLMAHTGTQICDDMYTSSYQLAHCKVRPSSPPFQTPEFRKQRPEINRTQGNFEVGLGGNGESQSPVGLSSRIGSTRLDRGTLSRGTETFIQSLRKYPIMSPDRSVSSDLVQRLIAYTQAKNCALSCHPEVKDQMPSMPRSTLATSPFNLRNTANCFMAEIRKAVVLVRENLCGELISQPEWENKRLTVISGLP